MKALWYLLSLMVFIQIATCRDFYIGMFRPNDVLVAQDTVYKDPAPFGVTTADYGRLFKCPITYFRVVDRLGMGQGPITTIVRGGLRKNFIVVRIKSGYRLPVSVNIYIGCEHKKSTTFRTTRLTSTQSSTMEDTVTTDTVSEDISTTISDDIYPSVSEKDNSPNEEKKEEENTKEND